MDGDHSVHVNSDPSVAVISGHPVHMCNNPAAHRYSTCTYIDKDPSVDMNRVDDWKEALQWTYTVILQSH
jgi:hypothetical protein